MKKNDKFIRWVEFRPAFDKRHSDPRKNCGIGAVVCCFYLKGKRGGVHFEFSTGIYYPETVKEYKQKNIEISEPMAYELAYHSPTPRWKGQPVSSTKCKILGGKCYSDGSVLNSEPLLNLLIKKGSKAVWEELEKYYTQTFKRKR